MPEWTTQYPATGIDTSTQLPNQDLTADEFPPASVGNIAANIEMSLEALVGSDLIETGSIRDKIRNIIYNDPPPSSPSIYDDEFYGPALDSKWTWIRAGQPNQTAPDPLYIESWGVSNGWLYMSTIGDTASFTSDAHCIVQNAPGGSWSIYTKIRLTAVGGLTNCGIFIDDGTNNNIIWHSYGYFSTTEIRTSTDFIQAPASGNIIYRSIYGPGCYLKLSWNGTLFTIYSGVDKDNWIKLATFTPTAWTPSRFGLYTFANNAVDPSRIRHAQFNFFRFTSP